jgi:hypothetical protein
VFSCAKGRIVAYRSYLGRLAELAGARSRVTLFGSHAGHAAHACSDLDFLVIEPEVAESPRGSILAAPLVRVDLAAPSASAFDIADRMGDSPEECMRKYVHTRSEDARYRMRRAVAEAARQVS